MPEGHRAGDCAGVGLSTKVGWRRKDRAIMSLAPKNMAAEGKIQQKR